MGATGSVPILGLFSDDDDSDSGRSEQQRAELERRAREQEEIVRMSRQEAEEARRRAIDAERRAQLAIESSRETVEAAERALRVAQEQAEIAQIHQKELELAMHETAEALRRAEEERLATERRWFDGVRPERHPSDQDIVQMQARHGYSPNFIHLAVVGSAGSGKSSFINAVRGLSNNDPSAARTGIVETTDNPTSYPDPRPNSRIIWYDIPGAGTPSVPDWQYFNDLGLYIFDCIIILIDNRVLESDLAILSACEQFTNAKAFIVRSKSDQHINNMVYDRMPSFDPHDFDIDDETRRRFLQIRSEERRRFVDETRQNVRVNLEGRNLASQRVYIVCKDAMLARLRNSRSSNTIDEADLQNDVEECVRRCLQSRR